MIFCVAEQCPQRMSVCVRCIYYVHTSSYLYIYKYVAILVPWYVLLHIHTLYCNILYYCVTVLKNNQTGHKRKKGISDIPSKRGSSLRNYLDQTQSSEFGQKEEGENHPGDDHGA